MSDPDQRLMERFQEGDVSAFEVLLHKYQAPVLALVRRYLGSRSAGVDDVAQEVFVRIYRSKHTYEPKAKVGTWIYRVTVNTCLNEIRRLGADKNRRVAGFSAVFGDDDGGDAAAEALADRAAPAPTQRMEAGEVEARVREAVDALPEQQRLAVVLSRYHQLPYEEVAAAIGSTVPAVKSLLTRARENLRRALAPYVTGSAAGDVPAADDDPNLEEGAPASRRGPPRRSHDDEPR
jgi:RNA polymerase sigma-70 factor (ECF subfamily)